MKALGWRLVFDAVAGPMRARPGRSILSVLGIALGVALGFAVHLINVSALDEFLAAARRFSGEADLILRGGSTGLPEALYPALARLPGVEDASPVLEVDAPLPGRRHPLHIVGLDPFRAGHIAPQLAPALTGSALKLARPRSLLLSPASARALGLGPGRTVIVQAGLSPVPLEIVSLLPAEPFREEVGVMDIASVQWLFHRLGRLTQIDLRLAPGTDPEALKQAIAPLLPAGASVLSSQSEGKEIAQASRAYRVNLGMLALVALITGAFLVFSTQALSVLERRRQLALLRALGLTQKKIATLIATEGATIGLLGSTLGLALGYASAVAALYAFGGDLGAGYFSGVAPHPRPSPWAALGFFCLGVAGATLGALAPALEAARTPPAQALKAGDVERVLVRLAHPGSGLAVAALGLALTPLPAVDGIPIFGYAAVGLIILAGVLLAPWLVTGLLRLLPLPSPPPARLAIAQLRGAPGQAATAVAAVLVSFSLAAAMAIMVTSFRDSFEGWLQRMLPADIYLRSASGGDTGFLTPEDQKRIAATSGIARAAFARNQTLLLDPRLPPVTLLARELSPAEAARFLPLTGAARLPSPGAPPPVWVSEAVADLYRVRAGDRIRLPIGSATRDFTVAGVWRDYAHPEGAILIERRLYENLASDFLANDSALWLAPGARREEVIQALRERLPASASVEIRDASQVRRDSLAIFDRTFAVTYALEAVALAIGLFGVGAAASAQALARRSEFGMLHHVGMTRSQVGVLLATEGALLGAIGAALGLILGFGVSLILIHVVNRQSFHWSMDLHVPWLALAVFSALLLAAAGLAAAWGGRRAMSAEVVQAVREDW